MADSQPPTSPPPCTRLTTPAGNPSACSIWTSRVVVPGVQIAGLHHGGAANGQRERQLLEAIRGKFHGVITHDPDRFLDRDGQVVRAEAVVRIPVGMLGQTGGVVPDSRRTGNLVLGLGNGLSGLQRFDQASSSRSASMRVPARRSSAAVPRRTFGPNDRPRTHGLPRSPRRRRLPRWRCDSWRRGHHVPDCRAGSPRLRPDLLAIDDVGPDVGGDRRRVSAGDRGHVRCFRPVVLEYEWRAVQVPR